MAQLRFVMRSGPAVGKEYPLEAQEIFIGRDATNMVVINDAEVSRRHARMERRGNAYVIQDLGSTNGTFINGVRLSGIQVLNPGDIVTFGEGITLAYEPAVVVDLNATVLTEKSSRTFIQRPNSAPTPTPPRMSVPVPAYSGQVPAGPAHAGAVPAGVVPMPQEAASGKKTSRKTVIIIAVVAIVLILCLCVGLLLIADTLRMDCAVPFKWFFNIIGPMVGYGVCP